jgi:NAD(P)H-hydrate epimerase
VDEVTKKEAHRGPDTGTGGLFTSSGARAPVLSVVQMREVDRIMVDELHIELIQMMENAGRSLAELAQRLWHPATATVVAGPGNNGGGGLAAARHLHNRGVAVSVTLGATPTSPAGAHQLDILERIGVVTRTEPVPSELVVDALVGYGLDGAPRGRTAELIEWVNAQESPVLSLDCPSGMNLTSGREERPCVLADATMTLALAKRGLSGTRCTGRLFLADISVPATVYSTMGLGVGPLFSDGSIVELLSEEPRAGRGGD